MFKKKQVKKIQSATKEELGKLHEEYEAVMTNVNGMSPAGLLAIAVVGVVMILSFSSRIFDVIGLVLLFYPLYVFIHRGAHRKGYFEGYYDMMAKAGSREHVHAEKSGQK